MTVFESDPMQTTTGGFCIQNTALLKSMRQSREIMMANILNSSYMPRPSLPTPPPAWLTAYELALAEANDARWVVGL